MAAAMNGMALHGGVIPYSGTFLVFSDYCRPAIRLAALMGMRVIYVMTHDSIGLGEDGPTHQPVEHLARLRAIPNLLVFRPADAVETAECWELALRAQEAAEHPCAHAPEPADRAHRRTPTKIFPRAAPMCLRACEGRRKVTFLATGSEVEIAMKARELLKAEGIGARVVSMPCWELFEEQDATYREPRLGPGTVKVAIEAACADWLGSLYRARRRLHRHARLRRQRAYKDLYKHFGITAEAAAEAALARLKKKN